MAWSWNIQKKDGSFYLAIDYGYNLDYTTIFFYLDYFLLAHSLT